MIFFGFELNSLDFHKLAISVLALFYKLKLVGFVEGTKFNSNLDQIIYLPKKNSDNLPPKKFNLFTKFSPPEKTKKKSTFFFKEPTLV